MKPQLLTCLISLGLASSCTVPTDSESSEEPLGKQQEAATDPSTWPEDDKLPPMAPLIADRGEQLVSAYKTVKDPVEAGIKFLQMVGFLKSPPSQESLIYELRAEIEKLAVAEAWRVDAHVYADRVAALIQTIDIAAGKMREGRPMIEHGKDGDLLSGVALTAFEEDPAAFSRIYTKSQSATDGPWSNVISTRPDHPSDNLYDWRVGVPALMQAIGLRLQIMSAVEPSFKNTQIYDDELVRHQGHLENHMKRMIYGTDDEVGGVRCGSKPLGSIGTAPYPRLGTRIACADINTGIEAWQDLPASLQDQPGCSQLNTLQVPEFRSYVDANGLPVYYVVYVTAGAYNISESCLFEPTRALERTVLGRLPLRQLRSMIDTLAVYRDPALESSTVGATCQSWADQYGIAADETFGTAPSTIQMAWARAGCNTAASWLVRARRAPRPAVNINQDGKPEVTVFRPATAEWFSLVNTNPWTELAMVKAGVPGSVPVPADYNGDGTIERATWHAQTGKWSWTQPGRVCAPFLGCVNVPNAPMTVTYGAVGDIPVPGDYDNDRKTDVAVWRPAIGRWFIKPSSGAAEQQHEWGASEDTPVIGDYDADGYTDRAVWSPSSGNWYIASSRTNSAYSVQWGLRGDVPVPADYDGDGKTDQAVFRDGTWWILPSINGAGYGVTWGEKGDVPMPADFDADRKADFVVWRPSEQRWYIAPSSSGAYWVWWGAPRDLPVP